MTGFAAPERLDELGRRLCDPDSPSEDDQRHYAAYRNEHRDALARVDAVLLGLAQSELPPRFHKTAARLKTLDSVVNKLRRKPNHLSEMQDIAGCRLTVPSLREITHISHLLTDEFEATAEKDYTERSKSGYRAYHLILRLDDGYLVEVQLRTEIQHAWANLSETLAYRLDRSIKAGGGPPGLRRRLEELSDQGRHIDETLGWTQNSAAAFAEMRNFLQERESDDWLIHRHLHAVDDILSLLRVVLHLHQDVADEFRWQLSEFELTEDSEGGL